MTALGINNPNSKWMREYNRRTPASKPIPYTPAMMRRHLEIYRNAAANKMARGLELATGDMWTRAWESYREYSEQIRLLDAAAGGQQ
jgi:hypothetical protein